MFLISVKLTLLVLSVVPFLLVASIIFRKYSRKAYREVRTNVSNINAFLSENLSGMKIIQVFNQEDKKFKEFTERNTDLHKSNLKEVWTFAIFRPVIYVLYMIALLLVVYFAANDSLDVIGNALSTDEEINDEYYQIVKPFVAKEYLLQNDSESNKTTVSDNYFFEVSK